MYKIMLVEDEPEVLDAIIETIDWASFSFEKPVGCRDGAEAIRIIDKGFRPDVLITDICMPFTDGLELTKYVVDKYPKTVVAILSGYNEFSYAQKALQMKVYDYVLKPVTPNQINELLGRLGEELSARRVNDNVLDQFEPFQVDSASAQVAKAERYIREHYGDPNLSLQSITEYLAVSVSYFSSLFKARTGQTFVEYLTKIRMDKAKQLLLMSDRRSYEIASDVGFSDPHYFSAAFKRFTGMSPREFRESGCGDKQL